MRFSIDDKLIEKFLNSIVDAQTHEGKNMHLLDICFDLQEEITQEIIRQARCFKTWIK